VSFLLHNLLHFGQVLHATGLDVPAGRMIDVASALEHVEIGRRTDFYFTLRALLVQRPQDFARFDEAFRVFWRTRSGEWSPHDVRAMGERRRIDPTSGDPPLDAIGSGGAASPRTAETVRRTAALSYSDRETYRTFRTKDFGQFDEADLRRARLTIAQMQWDIGRRRSRRWSSAPAGELDMRRVVSRYARAGELLTLPSRQRPDRPRPIVLIGDVSGSMDRYTRLLLYFVHGLSQRLGRIETFLFATRLTRVTRELAARNVTGSIGRIPWRLPDWGGGTRIGEALRTFNVHWARRVMRRGPVVLLISDGWDRGDPALLKTEIARLQRSCYRLIWLNPLLGSPDYRPMTRGMQAALPFVDDFLPVHNLASLEALAEHLEQLPPRRSRFAGRRSTLSRGVRGDS
jgi:uncharacterized protein with von Willebrand factor type A (vWA) domain